MYLARIKNAKLEHPSSNRLNVMAFEDDKLEIEKRGDLNFSDLKSLDEIEEVLRTMCVVNLHIIGSRDFIYHTGKMADLVTVAKTVGMVYPSTLLTRSFNLRKAVVELTRIMESDYEF